MPVFRICPHCKKHGYQMSDHVEKFHKDKSIVINVNNKIYLINLRM